MTGSITIEEAAGALGAYARNVSLADAVASDALFAQIRAAVLEHQVLFVRGQTMQPPVFEAFAQRFGQVLGHPAYPLAAGTKAVQLLESTAENPSKIEVWHSDMTFASHPPSFTLLHAQVIPEAGGDTMWASAQAAYEALSAPMRRFLDGLAVVHDFRHGFKESLAEPGGRERLAAAIAANPPVSHPLVRTHPDTGAKSIYVNALFSTHVEGLTALESTRLLEFLYSHVGTAEFTVRLRWQPGTIAVWDNRSTQHRPVNDYFPHYRLMHRVTIAGERPG